MNGYWVFPVPLGYRYEKTPGHGKLIVRDEPVATLIQTALEGYASGRFETPVEVKRFLENAPDFPKDRDGTIHPSRITELLTRPLYAGYISHEPWRLHMIRGKHEGLVDLATWQKVQE